MIMKKSDIIKLLVLVFVMPLIMIGISAFWMWVEPSVLGLMIGGIFSFLFLLWIIAFCIPKWFKEYIDEFWKEEERKCQEKEEKENLQL